VISMTQSADRTQMSSAPALNTSRSSEDSHRQYSGYEDLPLFDNEHDDQPSDVKPVPGRSISLSSASSYVANRAQDQWQTSVENPYSPAKRASPSTSSPVLGSWQHGQTASGSTPMSRTGTIGSRAEGSIVLGVAVVDFNHLVHSSPLVHSEYCAAAVDARGKQARLLNHVEARERRGEI
jgi:hypothetical protein